MPLTRAVVIVLVLSLAGAAILAVVSRAPASVRLDKPEPAAFDPDHGASFTDAQIARSGAYRGPSYLSLALSTAIRIVLLVLLMRGAFGSLVAATERVPGGWPVRAALLGAGLAVLSTLLLLPPSFVRGFAMERAWGLSTQDVGGWLSDQARSLGIGAVVAAVSAIAFFAVARVAPRTWWLWGWLAFSGLTALMVFLWPVAIAPLYNRFVPLQDEGLARRATALSREAGVPVDQVLVADASRRTTAENAYVAGLGATKRLVLYDTLVRAGDDDETLFVVGHELGHRAEGHIWKSVAISSLGLLVGFGVLAWLVVKGPLLSWSGASSLTDLRVIPALLLFAVIAGIVVLPVETAVSRRFEARADEVAVRLTGDADTAVSTFRRLGLNNLADLRPPRAAVWLLFTHPPTAERIEAVVTKGAETNR